MRGHANAAAYIREFKTLPITSLTRMSSAVASIKCPAFHLLIDAVPAAVATGKWKLGEQS